MEIKKGKTRRGFALWEFKDENGKLCSIQKSSDAAKDCIWLGIDEADPIILCRDADKLGLEVKTTGYWMGEAVGWQKYELPKEVFIGTRMELTRSQARKSGKILIKFSKKGEL